MDHLYKIGWLLWMICTWISIPAVLFWPIRRTVQKMSFALLALVMIAKWTGLITWKNPALEHRVTPAKRHLSASSTP